MRDHDPELSDRQVRRARRAELRRVWRGYRDRYERALAARRVLIAYRALRTEEQRRQVLTDLAVQVDWPRL